MPALSIPAAVVALQGGGVIAYPTEAVWGLGCDPFDEAAVMRLLALKQREVAKGLILVAGALDAFEHLLDWDALPTDRREAVFATWPGPHTWIVPVSGRVPHGSTGMHDGVAVRVSAHPIVPRCAMRSADRWSRPAPTLPAIRRRGSRARSNRRCSA